MRLNFRKSVVCSLYHPEKTVDAGGDTTLSYPENGILTRGVFMQVKQEKKDVLAGEECETCMILLPKGTALFLFDRVKTGERVYQVREVQKGAECVHARAVRL